MNRRNAGRVVGLGVVVVMAGCEDYSSNILQRSGDDGEDRDQMNGEVAPTSPRPSSLGPRPEFGPTVRQADPPPPLSGGTIAVAPNGTTVVAADPDRDRVYVVDIHSAASLRTIALSLHDEPGRVAIDGSNRAHVALRRGGAIVTIDIATGTVLYRREACSAPRGIAHDPGADVVHVACAGGELVTFPAGDGAELGRRTAAKDLRDVAVVPGGLALTTFRDAAILRVADGEDVAVEQPVPTSAAFGRQRVAWRMISAPGPVGHEGESEVLVAAQKAPESGPDVPVPPTPPAYYGAQNTVDEPCMANGPGPIVRDRGESLHLPLAVLPVDVAATSDQMVVAAAGNSRIPSMPQLVFVRRLSTPGASSFNCHHGDPAYVPNAQLTSVAFAQGGKVVVALSREPAALVVVDAGTRKERTRIALSIESREDTGHSIFHSNSGVGVACASCHPDGRDDGHAWRSVELGPRRTPSLLGTLANTAPYHWNGEAKDMAAVVELTFQSRMNGPVLTTEQTEAMTGWLGALQAPPASKAADPAAASRGKQTFEGAGNCSTCHSGAMRTNNASADVSTGGTFQVPSLIGVSWRAPHLHDGSAPSVKWLLERGHGGGTLQPSQLVDLTAYVNTL